MNKQELKELVEVRNNELQDVNYWASDYHKGHDRATRFFLHLLDQLDEPEITEKQAWEVIGSKVNTVNFDAETFYKDMRKIFKESKFTEPISNLSGQYTLVPKSSLVEPEKPVIPQFVATAIENVKENRKKITILTIFDEVRVSGFYNECVDNWILKNPDLFTRAWLNGYIIEPPKTLQVLIKNYDSTVYKTELPEDEAMKLIEGWKEDGNE